MARARLVAAQQKLLAAEEQLRLAQSNVEFVDAIEFTLLPIPDIAP